MATHLHSYPLKSWLHRLLLLCLCLPLLTSCESHRIIVNALDEREANEIIVFLSGKGIDATKVQNTASAGGGGAASKVVLWDISVPSGEALEAMSYLNQAGLPRRRSQNLLNIFTGSGLVPSEMEQKIRYQAGLAEQIASTIRKMDGILDAEVQLSFPEEDPLNPNKNKQSITASVFVKHNGILDDPNSHLVTKIKRLVAASVPGLNFDNVTVVGEKARYNDITTDLSWISTEDSKQYVKVWGITIAKDSLILFQLIFFTFIVIVVLFTVLVAILAWKLYPVVKEKGGVLVFFHLRQPAKKKEEKESQDKDQKEKKEKEESKDQDADIDADHEPEEDEEEKPKEKNKSDSASMVDKDVDQT